VNPGGPERKVVVRGKIEGACLRAQALVNTGETRLVEFRPRHLSADHLPESRIWWPYQRGDHSLYDLKLEAVVDGAVADPPGRPFGIRGFTSSLDEKARRLFR